LFAIDNPAGTHRATRRPAIASNRQVPQDAVLLLTNVQVSAEDFNAYRGKHCRDTHRPTGDVRAESRGLARQNAFGPKGLESVFVTNFYHVVIID